MRKGGLEPPRDCSHYHLKVARIPIPPLSLEGSITIASTSLPSKKKFRISLFALPKRTEGGRISFKKMERVGRIEKDRLFANFISLIAQDALENPTKLKDLKEVWGSDWDDLLRGVIDDEVMKNFPVPH